MKRTTMMFSAGAAAGAAIAVAAAMTGSPAMRMTYEVIPPDPTEAYERIGNLDANLVQAIEKAERAVDGRAYTAFFDLDAEPPTVTVTVFAEGKTHRIVVDAEACAIHSQEEVQRFPGISVEGEWTETDSGLRYFDIEVGEGDQPDEHSIVSVHYTGYLLDGRKFDSSIDRGQPAQFALAQVIPGWREGVATMRVGGRRKLIIPYHIGYGEQGQPMAGIPPRATLVFDVQLLSIRQWPSEQQPQRPQRPQQPADE